MSFWNYRVLLGDAHAGIYQCHWEDDGRLTGRSEEPVAAIGNDVADLAGELGLMVQALGEPPLSLADVDAAIAGTGLAIVQPSRESWPVYARSREEAERILTILEHEDCLDAPVPRGTMESGGET